MPNKKCYPFLSLLPLAASLITKSKIDLSFPFGL